MVGQINCILESILFFSLLRMIVILFQEYYLNDNIYIVILYDITSNKVYKQSFIILYQFNPPILLGYTLFDSCFSIFVIAIVLHAAVCQLAK